MGASYLFFRLGLGLLFLRNLDELIAADIVWTLFLLVIRTIINEVIHLFEREKRGKRWSRHRV